MYANGVIITNGSITSYDSLNTTGNVIAGNLRANSNITATGNITAVANIHASSVFGNLSATSAVVSSVTGTTSSVTGNVTGNMFISTATGTGNNYRIGSAAWLGDISSSDTVRITGFTDPANGYIVFGNGNNAAKLGRAGTGSLTYSGDMSLTGNLTANNLVGNLNLASGNVTAANFIATHSFWGGNLNGTLTRNNLSGTSNANLIFANIADTDFFKLTIGGTSSDAGFVAIDVGDNGNEQVFVRQFTGTNPTRTLTLLDTDGNTQIPGNLNVTGIVSTTSNIVANNFVGNLAMSVGGGVTANIINTTVAGTDFFRIQIGGDTNNGYASYSI